MQPLRNAGPPTPPEPSLTPHPDRQAHADHHLTKMTPMKTDAEPRVPPADPCATGRPPNQPAHPTHAPPKNPLIILHPRHLSHPC
jgi:hypothetical protein